MSDSNITKQVYAISLRELVQNVPFEKITVAQICEKHGLSRRSFYYHFKDKYDLVAWIFDMEYAAFIKNHSFTSWEFLDTLCSYLYENRNFYRKVLKIQGQNSFSDHLEEFISPLIQNRLKVIFGQDNVPSICINLLMDGFICSIKRWLLDKDCIPPEEFVTVLKTLPEKLHTLIHSNRYTAEGFYSSCLLYLFWKCLRDLLPSPIEVGLPAQ